jgi:hypothetical protein
VDGGRRGADSDVRGGLNGSMQHFSVVVEADALEDAMQRIWDTLMVRGEMQVRAMDGKFRIDVISERDLTPAQLEKLPGKRPG